MYSSRKISFQIANSSVLSCSYLNNVILQNGALIHLTADNNVLENSSIINKINLMECYTHFNVG